MKKIELTTFLMTSYQEYREATQNKEVIERYLNPLLDNLLFKMQITLSDDNVGIGRCKESVQRVITDRNELYLASEDDAERFFKASHELYIQEGYDVVMNHCPILIARSKEVKAEQTFIDESMYLVEGTKLNRETLNSSLSGRKEYLKLTIDLIEKIEVHRCQTM